MKVVGLEILEDESFGGPSGFLVLRRTRLRNRREDGSLSDPYTCDFAVRPRAPNAVVVALYHLSKNGVEVLLRDALRPSLSLGRDDEARLFLREVVAGLIEPEDHGDAGVRKRAALEAFEEAGYRVDPSQVTELGAHAFPAPGAIPEAYRFVAVEIEDKASQEQAPGDGSPMEEGAVCHWMPLDDAISACVRGEIDDLKTEVVLRRLRDHLSSSG